MTFKPVLGISQSFIVFLSGIRSLTEPLMYRNGWQYLFILLLDKTSPIYTAKSPAVLDCTVLRASAITVKYVRAHEV